MNQDKWKWRVRVEPGDAARATAEAFNIEPEVYQEGTSSLDSFDEVVGAVKDHIPDLLSIEYVLRIDPDLQEAHRDPAEITLSTQVDT